MPSPAAARTDQKVLYARLHLAELDKRGTGSNDDWENAHQEDVFYHLTGAVEGLLHEINESYALEIPMAKVRWDTVRSELQQSGHASRAYARLDSLRSDAASWLAQLIEWRNHGAHRQRVGKMLYLSVGAGTRRDDQFKDPRTGQEQAIFPGLGCQALLQRLTDEVVALIHWCRGNDVTIASS